MIDSPRNPICAPVSAAIGTLAPAEAAGWADLLAQPAAAMAPVERRARLALRIALLQRAMQTLPEAPRTDAVPPDDAQTDAQSDSPPPERIPEEAAPPQSALPQTVANQMPAPDGPETEATLSEDVTSTPPAAPTPQRRRKRRPRSDAATQDEPQP